MADRAIIPTPKTFAELVAAVRAALITGQTRVDRAYLETYRNTGLLIDAHLLLCRERADYGARVVPRLAEALGVDERLLYRCLRFVREYPILTARSELGWSHYRVLLEVADKSRRKALEAGARRHRWTSAELERRVRAVNAIDVTPTAAANGGPAAQSLVPRRGTPGLHLVVARDDGLAVDLGFKLYRPLAPEPARRFAAGDIVRFAGDGSVRRAEAASKAELFTYATTLRRVIDGDTLVVSIAVAPDIVCDLELRLRGLDCAELGTPEGKAAKRFVQALAARAAALTVATTKSDKYDRYLADVFLRQPKGDGPEAQEEEIYLNHALLQNGHARPYDGSGPKPWPEPA